MTIPLDKGSTQNCLVVTKTLENWDYALSNTATRKTRCSDGPWFLQCSLVHLHLFERLVSKAEGSDARVL